MNRKKLVLIVGGAGAALVFAALLFRPRSEPLQVKKPPRRTSLPQGLPEEPERDWRDGPIITVPQEKPNFKSADPRELAKALDQASIVSLIDNLRVASEQGDDTTMRALIEGLRRRGTAARALVEREMARVSSNSNANYAMKQVIQ